MTTAPAPRPAAVAAVLAQSARWTSARRKSDGRPFYIVPGSKPGVSYYADATACTCPSARHSTDGRCKHSEAIRQHRQPKKTARQKLDELFPPCAAGCGDLVERQGERCYRCLSDEVYRQDRGRRSR